MTDEAWSIEALKQYVDVQVKALEQSASAKAIADQQRFDAQGKAIDAASTVVDRALVEARVGVAEQFRVLGEKVDRLGDTVGVPRQEMDAVIAGVTSKTRAELTEAVSALVKQFSADFDRLTKAVEAQGEQFSKAITSQNDQRSTDLKRLADKVDGIETGVSDLNAIQLQRQGRSSGVSWTGKTFVSVVGVAVAIITVLTFLLAHPWRP